MTQMPPNEGEISNQTSLAESGKVFVSFLRSCAIRLECQSKINKLFDMVPGNFEKGPDEKAVHLRVLQT